MESITNNPEYEELLREVAKEYVLARISKNKDLYIQTANNLYLPERMS